MPDLFSLLKRLIQSILFVVFPVATTAFSAEKKDRQEVFITAAQLIEHLPDVSGDSIEQLLKVVNRPKFNGIIAKSDVDEIRSREQCSLDELMITLLPLARLFAQPSVSQYHVGIVALASSGNFCLGANIEAPGSPLGLTVHGEQAAIVNALVHGEDSITSLALTAAPCGHCRQFLYEMHNRSDLRFLIDEKPATRTSTLHELLPDPFGPQDLKLKSALFDSSKHDLRLDSESSDSLTLLALEACRNSYAPYTESYSAVGVRIVDGSMYSGFCVENAAYNPSISPMQAACVQLAFSGVDFSDITDVVLIEVRDAKISQNAVTKQILNVIAPNAELKIVHASVVE